MSSNCKRQLRSVNRNFSVISADCAAVRRRPLNSVPRGENKLRLLAATEGHRAPSIPPARAPRDPCATLRSSL
eukprot:scaffold215_cov423-Prasinococcus_capsulatus_cf.AAC.7